MKRTLVTCTVLALALTGFAGSAAAQCPAANQAGPYCIEGDIPDPNTGNGVTDPNGGTKELGPVNASTTKIGFINSAAVPMLSLTNPNTQVDLNLIYLANARDGSNNLWVYFAWFRDSVNGSGFVSLEANRAASGCDYTSNQTLLQCNPWGNRANGDPLFSWDQQGNSHNIYYRVFDQSLNAGKGGFKTPANCPGTVEDLGCLLPASVAKAEYNDDFSGGELAINLTALFNNTNDCKIFQNVIPGTVTGNSDTADYKDVVLAPLAISNCGNVSVTKVTIPSGQSSTFPYTLDGPGNIFPSAADSDCTTSGTSLALCQSTLTSDGDTDLISEVNPSSGNTYTLVEGALQAGWSLVSIQCVLGGTTYAGSGFPVVAGQTTACTITNRRAADVDLTTVQHAIIYDEATVSGLLRDAAETPMSISISLWNADCSAQIGSTTTVPIPATVTSFTATSPQVAAPAGTYNWRVSFSGNNFNNAIPLTPCGHERTVVSFSYQ
jgi:hypothetical protein